MRTTICWIVLVVSLASCVKEEPAPSPQTTAQPVAPAEPVAAPPPSPPKPTAVKSRPTWETRTIHTWRKMDNCNREGTCTPMGKMTVLVEFAHNGCRNFRQLIDAQAAFVQGYMPEHQFILVVVSTDALTNMLYDSGRSYEPPCRAFFFDDTLKPDQKFPSEDQWFVELCTDTTSTTETISPECRGQLSEKRLYGS